MKTFTLRLFGDVAGAALVAATAHAAGGAGSGAPGRRQQEDSGREFLPGDCKASREPGQQAACRLDSGACCIKHRSGMLQSDAPIQSSCEPCLCIACASTMTYVVYQKTVSFPHVLTCIHASAGGERRRDCTGGSCSAHRAAAPQCPCSGNPVEPWRPLQRCGSAFAMS